MGRVEVCLGGEWGTVCGDPTFWSQTDVLIVCRQLFGLFFSGEFEPVTIPLLSMIYLLLLGFRAINGFYGEGDGPVFDVTCIGTENRLDECTISNQTVCSHSQDGGAICPGMLVHH